MQLPNEFKYGLINIGKRLVLGLVVKEGMREISQSIEKTIIVVQLSNDGDLLEW